MQTAFEEQGCVLVTEPKVKGRTQKVNAHNESL